MRSQKLRFDVKGQSTRGDLVILLIGWPDIFAPIIGGAAKYTMELLRKLSPNATVYYERITGLKSHLRGLSLLTRYYDRNIDQVHVHGRGSHCVIGILLSIFLRKPLILTLYTYHFDEIRAMHKSAAANLASVALERIAMCIAHTVIVVSEWQRGRLPPTIMDKTIVVYPGTSELKAAPHFRDKHNSAVCVTAPLDAYRAIRKGVDILGEIAELTPQVTFHVVGGSSRQIKSLAIKTPPNVVFHGYLLEEQLENLLSRSRFVVAPSRHESFHIAVLEGMKYGCIPIVSESCGVQDILKDCGLVLPLSADLFSKGMIRLLEKKEEAERMRTESLRISERFTWKRTCDAYLAICQRVKMKRGSGQRRISQDAAGTGRALSEEHLSTGR
jgi:glycosyltransferase involved in cell wall biosynthesis